jgi:hypothetical protein
MSWISIYGAACAVAGFWVGIFTARCRMKYRGF